jgi:hypothetical protein
LGCGLFCCGVPLRSFAVRVSMGASLSTDRGGVADSLGTAFLPGPPRRQIKILHACFVMQSSFISFVSFSPRCPQPSSYQR